MSALTREGLAYRLCGGTEGCVCIGIKPPCEKWMVAAGIALTDAEAEAERIAAARVGDPAARIGIRDFARHLRRIREGGNG